MNNSIFNVNPEEILKRTLRVFKLCFQLQQTTNGFQETEDGGEIDSPAIHRINVVIRYNKALENARKHFVEAMHQCFYSQIKKYLSLRFKKVSVNCSNPR